MCYGKASECALAAEHINRVILPELDPVNPVGGALLVLWRARLRGVTVTISTKNTGIILQRMTTLDRRDDFCFCKFRVL